LNCSQQNALFHFLTSFSTFSSSKTADKATKKTSIIVFFITLGKICFFRCAAGNFFVYISHEKKISQIPVLSELCLKKSSFVSIKIQICGREIQWMPTKGKNAFTI
jgi:hypothetical protein